MSEAKPRERRKRDPEGTRTVILDAAQSILAQDGAEALSVSRVANLAGVNRGTAYQHFLAKEDLIQATMDRVSHQLLEAVFEESDEDVGKIDDSLQPDLQHLPDVIKRMAGFTMRMALYTVDNPDISRIWLFDVLSKKDPQEDVFYKRFLEAIERLANSDVSEPDIDIEALAVLMLSGFFLWPVWVDSHAKTKKGRKQMAERFGNEVLRLTLHGFLAIQARGVPELASVKPTKNLA
ncbi:TetR/AcrR family transcriptional regulator [Ketobacter sp. MCCC 1A13808]|uniref:TetR/AcrR family transcriptional regulator n=1 Tax=Ketobacter sp. MCCC 1A13808 TaxID=2602738 RepID=UPI000F22B13D|nr:TetR/AcrR family transcriptional regulator [Ketobacter sp. MCCC 1A13808]MVF13447.1 TetR/AcrR family transcriptional regulator [Ketobacter sp. MCCC 1A13808]RLP52966.1 MAG: TetR/AcrR family transcriptional regulator [Ketobacter sp.]